MLASTIHLLGLARHRSVSVVCVRSVYMYFQQNSFSAHAALQLLYMYSVYHTHTITIIVVAHVHVHAYTLYLWPDMFILCSDNRVFRVLIPIPILATAIHHPTVSTFQNIATQA